MAWTAPELPFIMYKTMNAAEREMMLLHTIYENCIDPDHKALLKNETEIAATVGVRTETTNITWLPDDVTDLVKNTYESVPEWSPLEAVLSENGALFYETPVGITHNSEDLAPIRAILWETLPTGYINIVAMVDTTPDDPYVSGISPEYQMIVKNNVKRISDYIKPGTSPLSARLSSYIFSGDRQSHDHHNGTVPKNPNAFKNVELDENAYRRHENRIIDLLGATWLLISQNEIIEDDTPVDTVVRKINPDNPGLPKIKAPVRVTVKRLARPARKPTINPGSGKKLTERIPVHGHWRQQACGPNLSLRKPIYIHDHFRGPKDAPIDDRPSVQIIRPGHDAADND